MTTDDIGGWLFITLLCLALGAVITAAANDFCRKRDDDE